MANRNDEIRKTTMKKLAAMIFAASLLAPIMASAGGAAPTVTVGECLSLRAALMELDGHVALDKNGAPLMTVNARGLQQPVTIPYKFGPGVVDKLADDRVLVDALLANEQKADADRREKETAAGAVGGDPVARKLADEEAAALAKPCPIADKLETVTDTDLNIDFNNLPPSVVAGLKPIRK